MNNFWICCVRNDKISIPPEIHYILSIIYLIWWMQCLKIILSSTYVLLFYTIVCIIFIFFHILVLFLLFFCLNNFLFVFLFQLKNWPTNKFFFTFKGVMFYPNLKILKIKHVAAKVPVSCSEILLSFINTFY